MLCLCVEIEWWLDTSRGSIRAKPVSDNLFRCLEWNWCGCCPAHDTRHQRHQGRELLVSDVATQRRCEKWSLQNCVTPSGRADCLHTSPLPARAGRRETVAVCRSAPGQHSAPRPGRSRGRQLGSEAAAAWPVLVWSCCSAVNKEHIRGLATPAHTTCSQPRLVCFLTNAKAGLCWNICPAVVELDWVVLMKLLLSDQQKIVMLRIWVEWLGRRCEVMGCTLLLCTWTLLLSGRCEVWGVRCRRDAVRCFEVHVSHAHAVSRQYSYLQSGSWQD